LDTPLNAGKGNARLTGGNNGAVSQGATDTITATQLGIHAGNVKLDQLNAISTFAADASGSVLFRNNGDFTVDTVKAAASFTTDAVGVTGQGGDVELRAQNNGPQTGAITLAAVVQSLGGATKTVRLSADGAVQQKAKNLGAITADQLGVIAGNDVILDLTANAVATTLAAMNTGSKNVVQFLNVGGITLGTVRAGTFFSQTVGVTTKDGDVGLHAQGSSIALNAAVSTGKGNVRLRADNSGSVTQTAAVTAAGLGASAAGSVMLGAVNGVGTFAANAGGAILFRNGGDLTLGTVPASTHSSYFTTSLSNVTANAGDVELRVQKSGAQHGDLTLVNTVTSAGLTQTVRLWGDGAVQQMGAGLGQITAAVLGIMAGDTVSLDKTANAVSTTFAANESGAGKAVNFLDGTGFSVGSVGAGTLLGPINGITTKGGNLTLSITPKAPNPDLFIDQPITTAGGSAKFNLSRNLTVNQTINAGAGTVTVNAEPNTATAIDVRPQLTASMVTLTGNNFGDTFSVAPSLSAPFTVTGGSPNSIAPGDTLKLHLADVAAAHATAHLTTKPGQGNGVFTFSAGFKAINYTSIETLSRLNVQITVIQDSNTHFNLITSSDIKDDTGISITLVSGQKISQPVVNQFILSPAFASPSLPFSAPSVAVADVLGNGVPDIIIGNGPGGPPLVTVIDGSAIFADSPLDVTKSPFIPPQFVKQFFAYDPNFRGGVWVAAGNLDNTGRASIVTGEDAGGQALVKIFKNVVGQTDAPHSNFVQVGAFDAYPGFTGGVRVAVGDAPGQPPVIVTAPGFGSPQPVKVFNVAGQLQTQFYPYGTGFGGGIVVAVGDFFGDGKSNDILTGPGTGIPTIQVFQKKNGQYTSILGIPAYDPKYATNFFTGQLLNGTLNSVANSGVSSVAFGAVGSTATRSILVGAGIGATATVTSIHAPAGATPTPVTHKMTMLSRSRAPRGVQLGVRGL
jgi:hypothetical protein